MFDFYEACGPAVRKLQSVFFISFILPFCQASSPSRIHNNTQPSNPT